LNIGGITRVGCAIRILGYPAVTEAMVNIRANLEKAVAEGILGPPFAARASDIAEALFYKERRRDVILLLEPGCDLPITQLKQF